MWIWDNPLPSNKILFELEQKLLLLEGKATVLTGQRVCLPRIFGLLVNCQHRVGFHVWSQENILLNAHIFVVWHTSWKPVTRIAAVTWFVSQESLSSWDIIRDECYERCAPGKGRQPPNFKVSSSPQALVGWALSSACPKKDLSAASGLWLAWYLHLRIKGPISGNDLLIVWRQVWGLHSCSAEGMESSMISHQTAGSGVSLK